MQQIHRKRNSQPGTYVFARPDGTPFTSKDVADIGQRIARCAGWPAAEVARIGAKCFRVGGATDYADELGVEGRDVLQRRGVWDSDLDFIYSRTTVQRQLDASARVGNARGTTVERALPGRYAQPPITFRSV